jgi:hypothetical protein
MCRSSSQILQKIRQLKLAPLTLNQERKSSRKAIPLAVLNRTIKWAPSLVTPRVLNLLVLIHIEGAVWSPGQRKCEAKNMNKCFRKIKKANLLIS